MAITTINNRAINRADTAASGESWTATSATASDFQAVGANTPAFEARLSADQTISDDTLTKINVNSEVFDTDSCYDHSTNYRFTPTVAGKYYIYWSCCGIASSNNVINTNVFIYFNGSQYNGAIYLVMLLCLVEVQLLLLL